jgi:translocation and assembly module TamB
LRTAVRNVSAQYQLANGNAEVRDLRAQLLGGELRAGLTMRNLTGKTESRLTAALRDVSVDDVERAFGDKFSEVKVTGRSTAELEATWGQSMQDLQARADVAMHGTVSGTKAAPGSQPVPVDVAVHGRYSSAREELTLAQSFVHMPQTQILLDGTISNRASARGRSSTGNSGSSLQVHVQANDLRELEAIADGFQQSPQPLGLAGQATFNGVVRGGTANPQLTGQLTASNLTARGTSWKLLRTEISLNPSEAALHHGELDAAHQGRMAFDVRVGLHNWSFLPESPISVTASATKLQMAEILKAANSSYPVEGLVSASLSLHGSELNPIGGGEIKLSQAKVQAETIQALDVKFEGTGDTVHAALNLRLPAGVAEGSLTYFPKQKRYEASLQADDVNLEKLATLKQRNLPVTGMLWLNANGSGTIDDPGAQISVELTKLKVQDRPIDALKLSGNLQHHVATLALDSQIASAALHGLGKVELAGDYQAEATLDTDDVPLQTLLVAYMPAQAADLRGNTVIHATLKGPLKKPDLLSLHLELPVLSVTYKNLEISAVTPIHADYADGVVKLEPAEIRGTGTELKMQGLFPIRSAAPATLNAQGTLDLQLLKIFQPDLQSSGQVRFDVRTEGTFANPNLQGQAEIVNANLRTEGAPTGLQNANGVLRFNNDRVQIVKLEGTVGGGPVQASGAMIFRPSLRFDLAMDASGVRVSVLQGVRSQLSGKLALSGNPSAAVLRGGVTIDSLNFTPEFDLSTFMNQFNSDITPPAAEGFANNVRLSISIQTTSSLNLVSRTLSVQGSADLRVAGTASDPVILGRANLTGGDVIFLGNRYVVEGGTVEFVNPVRTEPIVGLQATTSIQQYDINLSLRGPADRLQATYTSNPALPPIDIIHLIAFGSTSTSAAANQSSMSPESVVASQVSSQLTSGVAKLAGISSLSVNPNIGGSTGGKNAGPTISVQQRITSKLYVTFTADLTSTQNQTVQVQYDISKRWALSTTRDQNGGFGFDGRFRKSW